MCIFICPTGIIELIDSWLSILHLCKLIMMKYPSSVLFRTLKCNYYNLMYSKTMFIRSIDKPSNKTANENFSLQQPYTKFFVLDFEATCDNKTHLLKPQVDNYFKL